MEAEAGAADGEGQAGESGETLGSKRPGTGDESREAKRVKVVEGADGEEEEEEEMEIEMEDDEDGE